jgi:flagellar basal body P-ring formation protein FlgA
LNNVMRLGVITVTLLLTVNGLALSAPGSGLSRERPGMSAQAPPYPSVRLRSHVILDSGSMTMADLLPDSAPASLRQEARSVPLGSAPQTAMTRTLYRQQLQFLLRDHKALLRELNLPDEITVERAHHTLTREEVIQAIQNAIGDRKGGTLEGLDLQNIHFSSLVYVTQADPGLKVVRIQSDPLRNETRFRLWTSNEPGTLPFEVSVPGAARLPTLVSRHEMAPGEIVSANDFEVVMSPKAGVLSGNGPSVTELAGLETRAPLRAGQAVTRTEFGMPVLVKPGVLASLIVEGGNFSIKIVVTPLEQGVLGQEVRVRNTETRAVVEAKVIGRDRLLKKR